MVAGNGPDWELGLCLKFLMFKLTLLCQPVVSNLLGTRLGIHNSYIIIIGFNSQHSNIHALSIRSASCA